MAEGEAKKSKKAVWIIRGLLALVVVLMGGIALRWHGLRGDMTNGLNLYDEGKYEEACQVLTRVVDAPVSALRLRPVAQHALGLAKRDWAERIMTGEPDRAGYEKAAGLLAEAKALLATDERAEELYKECAAHLKAPATPAP